MCCFSPVTAPASWLSRLWPKRPLKVAETRIYARMEGAEQALVYSMTLSAAGEVAMLLPIPVASGAGDEAVRFVDLSGYPTFFEDLALGFVVPEPASRAKRGGFPELSLSPQTLKVHSVGSFEASYVPSVADFDRLDARFRLPDAVWSELPAVADYGFAVFKLKPGKAQHIHPMAFRFPTRDPARLFFPTVHIHDGAVHPTARFDHTLYHQGGAGEDRSWAAARAFMKLDRAAGLVDGDAHVYRQELAGKLPNRDTWIDLAPARAD